MPDLSLWPMFLAAIVMYTFDLCLIVPAAVAEDNFYHRLNKARPPLTLVLTNRDVLRSAEFRCSNHLSRISTCGCIRGQQVDEE